jgi:hypothetical protein
MPNIYFTPWEIALLDDAMAIAIGNTHQRIHDDLIVLRSHIIEQLREGESKK